MLFNEKIKLLSINELEELKNKDILTKEDMILFVENVNMLSFIKIHGYKQDWLKDSIDLIKRFDNENIKEYKIDETIFPRYIKFKSKYNNYIYIRSKTKSRLAENSLIYDYGITSSDVILSPEYLFFGYEKINFLREEYLEISNEYEYIKQFFVIAENFFREIKKYN